MPTTEEVAAPSAATGDNTAVALPQVTAQPVTQPAAKKRAVQRMSTGKGGRAGAVAVRAAKPQHNHPPYGNMIKAALLATQDKKGSSRAAILKYIMQHYEVGENATLVNSRLRMGLKRGVASGTLKQMRGTGASGSFRLADAKAEPAKKKAKKPAAQKTAAAGDMKMPSPKKSSRGKSSVKKAAPAKTSKAKVAPKKKAAAEAPASLKKGRKVATGSVKKAKAAPAKTKMVAAAKKPGGQARSKKVAAS